MKIATVGQYDSIPLASIGMPDPYIRGEANPEIIGLFVEMVKAEQTWSFPPVEIYKLSAPEKVRGREILYRIADGVKRYFAAAKCGLTQIPAVVRPALSRADAYVRQFETNAMHGEPFNRETRDRFIRTAVNVFKRTPDEVAIMVHLTRTSVDRIAALKQGKSATEVSKVRRKAAKKRRASGGKKKSNKVETWTVGGFADLLSQVREEVRGHRKDLRAWVLKADAAWSKHLDPTLKALQTLRED